MVEVREGGASEVGSSRSSGAELLAEWRERVATWILFALAGVAIVLMLWFGPTLVWSALVVGVLIVVTLLGLSAWSGAPRYLRSALLIALMAYAATMAALTGHDVGSAVVYGSGGVLLGTMLIDWRVGLAFLLFTTGLIGVVAWALGSGVQVLPATMPGVTAAELAAGVAFTFFMVGLIVLASLVFLNSRLLGALDERARAFEALERTNLALRASQEQVIQAGKMEVLGELSGAIAHDMNNALTVVLAEAELLRDEAPESAELIRDAVKHATALTRQLLAMGRRDLSQLRPIDLGAAVAQAVALVRRTVPGQVSVELEAAEGVGVLADPNQIQQVILNLSTNAAHAMPGGGSLRITVRGEGDLATVEVRDTGAGMDESVRARIFEPFFTTKKLGRGTGLGLSSARMIVEGLGGKISCESVLGEGTAFHISLPREAAPASLERDAERAGGSPSTLAGRRLLVVDDEVRVRTVAARALRAAGAMVEEASGGHEAIELAERSGRPFDLVWTDLVMPAGSGAVVIRWFAEHSPGTRLVACTGHSDDPELRGDLAAGRYPLVRKPFAPREAVEACAAALADT